MTRIRIQVLALVALASTLTYAQQDNKKRLSDREL